MSVMRAVVPQRAYRWNFTVMGLDFSFFLLGLSFASAYGVLPLFVHHLTASNLALGLIATVRAVGSSLPPILAARLTERLRRKKPFLLVVTTFERLPYLLLAIATPLLAVQHSTLLLWLFFLFIGTSTWFGGVGLPAWLDLLARMLPDDWRGRFFGYASAVGGLLGIVGAGLAAVILERFSWPTNFSICFYCTSACLAVSFVFIAVGREPAPTTPVPAKKVHSREYWRTLPGLIRADHNFAQYLLATMMVSAASMAVSFYVIDAKRVLHLADATAGLYAVVLMAASTLGCIGWGVLGDRIGHKRVVEGGTICTGLAALLAMLVHGVGLGVVGYGLVFVLVGLATSGIQLAALTFVVDFAPAAQRPTYVGLANLANVPFMAGAPLVGGFLADRAGYPVVFAVTLALAVAGTLIVRYRVIDPRVGAGAGAETGFSQKEA